MKKKTLVKCLAGFLAAAAIITYAAWQIQDSGTPRVAVAKPKSGNIAAFGAATAVLTYDAVWKYEAPSQLTASDVPAKEGTVVKAGDKLAVFDEDSVRLALAAAQEKGKSLRKQRSAAAEDSSAYELADWQLSKTEKAVSDLQALLDAKCTVSSPMDGEVVTVGAKPDTACRERDVLVSVCDTSKDATLTWTTPDGRFDPNAGGTGDDDPRASVTALLNCRSAGGVSTAQSVSLTLNSRRYISKNRMFEYTAKVQQRKDFILRMSNNQTVAVQIRKDGRKQDTVLPLSAITVKDDPATGEVFTAVWDKDRGSYVTKAVSVHIVDSDGHNAAVERPIRDPVVISSDRPLTDGMEVKVQWQKGSAPSA